MEGSIRQVSTIEVSAHRLTSFTEADILNRRTPVSTSSLHPYIAASLLDVILAYFRMTLLSMYSPKKVTRSRAHLPKPETCVDKLKESTWRETLGTSTVVGENGRKCKQGRTVLSFPMRRWELRQEFALPIQEIPLGLQMRTLRQSYHVRALPLHARPWPAFPFILHGTPPDFTQRTC